MVIGINFLTGRQRVYTSGSWNQATAILPGLVSGFLASGLVHWVLAKTKSGYERSKQDNLRGVASIDPRIWYGDIVSIDPYHSLILF